MLPGQQETVIVLAVIGRDALIVEDGHCVFDEFPADYVAPFKSAGWNEFRQYDAGPLANLARQFHRGCTRTRGTVVVGAIVPRAQSGQLGQAVSETVLLPPNS